MAVTIRMPAPQNATKVVYVAAGGDIADGRVVGAADPGIQHLTARVLDAMVARYTNLIIIPLGDIAYQSGSHPEFANNFDPYWGHANGIPANFVQESYTYLDKFSRLWPTVGNHEGYNDNVGEVEYTGYDDYFGTRAQGVNYQGAGLLGGRYYSQEPVFPDGKKYWRILHVNSDLAARVAENDSRQVAQMTWYKAQIAAADNDTTNGPHPGYKQHILHTAHHPFYNATGSGGTDNQAQFFQWLQDYAGGLKVAISGHYHYYMRMEPLRYPGTFAGSVFTPTYALSDARSSAATDLTRGVVHMMHGVAGTNKPNQGQPNPHTDHIISLINGTTTDPTPQCYGMVLYMLEPDRFTTEYVSVDDAVYGGRTDGPTVFIMPGAGTGPVGPTAALSMSKVSGAVPLTVTADASGSVAGDAPIQDYRWAWGDGTSDTVASAGGGTGTVYPQIGVIIMENAIRADVEANGPWEKSQEAKYQAFTKVWGVTHPSLPNYLAMLSGSPQGKKGTDATAGAPFAADNLLRQLTVKGIAFKVYAQDWNAGAGGGSYGGGPATASFGKHDPGYLFGSDIPGSDHVDFDGATGLINDVAGSLLPKFFFVIPNMRNDGHDTGTLFGDQWLQGLNPDSDSAPNAFLGTDDLLAHMDPNGILLVTYDEADADSSAYNATTGGGGQVYTAAYGPNKLGAADFVTAISLYGLTKAIQAAYGLPAFSGPAGQGVGQIDATYAPMATAPLGVPTAGSGGASKSANHTYANASPAGNPYHLVLTVSDTAGLSDMDAKDITASAAAVFQASLVITPSLTPAVGATETANASGSTSDGVNAITGYGFDWGDGTTVGGNGTMTSTRTHAYAAAGSFTVRVTVYNSLGQTSIATKTVTVAPVGGSNPPVLAAAVAQPRGFLGATAAGGDGADRDYVFHVDLDLAQSTFDAPTASFTIDWDDGTAVVTGTATAYSHDYKFNHVNAFKGGWGKRRIGVTVTDANGTDSIRVAVVIQRDHTLVGASGVT